MSTFLHWALYAASAVLAFGAATMAVVAGVGARLRDRRLARLFGLYAAILACVITLMILAAGDLR